VAGKIHRNSLKPGYKILWYEIKEVLGQGGFGITYLAYDPNLEKHVAIKEYLPIELAVREGDFSVHPVTDDHGKQYKWGLEKFIAEARTLSRFDHPNIVRVLSVTEENNTAYMVMSYEHGQSLQEKLKGKKTLEEAELLKILIPILGGLQQIHNAGFIHRDIKPDNIFIRNDGSPVLLDFGSARQALGEQTKTLTSLISPGYSPFEQYSSKGNEQGEWTDIYGLGATLYRSIVGVAPQDAIDRSNAILKTSKDIIVTAVEIGQGKYSERFLKAIDHALNFKPEDRPQSIAEWSNEFEPPASEAVTVIPTDNKARDEKRPTSLKKRFAPLYLGTAVIIIVAFYIGNRFMPDQANEALPAKYTDSELPKVIISEEEAVKEDERKRQPERELFIELGDDIRVRNAVAVYRSGNMTKAYELLKSYAEDGIPQAKALLAAMYIQGSGIQKDETAGLDLIKEVMPEIKKLADTGTPWAEYYIGAAYQYGMLFEKSAEMAIEWYEKAGQHGYVTAYVQAGEYYYEVERDYQKAIEYFTKASEKGHPRAMYGIGLTLESGNGTSRNIVEAVKTFIEASERGYIPAFTRVGDAYIKGLGVLKNDELAIKYYKVAAEAGHSYGQWQLGLLYSLPNSGYRDINKAEFWLKKAVEQENYEAMYTLGYLYENGKKDIPKAIRLYIKAAEYGQVNAMGELGFIYSSQNKLEESYKWYLLAAEEGNSVSQQAIGHFYETGKGPEPKNLDKAIYWYKKAAEQNNMFAMNRLSFIYRTGPEDYRDMDESIRMLTKLADLGNAFSQSLLGTYYKKGDGVEKDILKAIELYEKSVEKGDSYGMGYLGNLYLNGNGVKKDVIRAYAYCAVSSAFGIATSSNCQSAASKILSKDELKQAKQLTKEIYDKFSSNVTAK